MAYDIKLHALLQNIGSVSTENVRRLFAFCNNNYNIISKKKQDAIVYSSQFAYISVQTAGKKIGAGDCRRLLFFFMHL